MISAALSGWRGRHEPGYQSDTTASRLAAVRNVSVLAWTALGRR